MPGGWTLLVRLYAVCPVLVRSANANMLVVSHYKNTPMQYTAIFQGCKKDNFQMKDCDVFLYFCSKHRLWVHVQAVLTSTHNICY